MANIQVTVTLQWDAAQFAGIMGVLTGEDRAKATELTGELKSSADKLAAAVATNQPNT